MSATLRCDTIQNAASTNPNITLDGSANATVGGTLAMGSSFKRNRIINGAMVIDQRNAGAEVNPAVSGNYYLDRWQIYSSVSSKFKIGQNAGSVTPPVGFSNYLGITSLSSYAVGASDYFLLRQTIEGYNTADFAWGTANAKTITLSFWVYSSLTGTFGGSLQNVAVTYSYPFTYSISAANTWTYVTITVPGALSTSWQTTNSGSISLTLGLGVGSTLSGTAGSWSTNNFLSATGATSVVGTNGATFYITGVQLEVGSVATPYERQIYSEQLAQCQRYLPAWNWTTAGGNDAIGIGYSISTVETIIAIPIPVTPRVRPTGISSSGLSNMVLRNGSNTGGTPTAIAANVLSSGQSQQLSITTTAGSPTLTAGQGSFMFATGAAQILFTGCEL